MRLKSLVGSSGGPLFFSCGEESLLKAPRCYFNGQLGNASARYADQRGGEGKSEGGGKRRRVKNQSATRLTTLCHRGFMIC